jgi:hypothetical protein
MMVSISVQGIMVLTLLLSVCSLSLAGSGSFGSTLSGLTQIGLGLWLSLGHTAGLCGQRTGLVVISLLKLAGD